MSAEHFAIPLERDGGRGQLEDDPLPPPAPPRFPRKKPSRADEGGKGVVTDAQLAGLCVQYVLGEFGDRVVEAPKERNTQIGAERAGVKRGVAGIGP